MAWNQSPNERCAQHLSGLCAGWTGTGLFELWNMESERENCNNNSNNNTFPKGKRKEKTPDAQMAKHSLGAVPERGPLGGEIFGWKDWSCE